MNDVPVVDLAAVPFADAVAVRSKREVADVISVFDKHGIVASPSPPPAKSLRINRISFSGVKMINGKSDAFEFSWDVSESELFAVVSAENFRGKSTILQVALWALRGEIKNLTTTVENWIQHVDVEFAADQRVIRVEFLIADGVESGTVSVRSAQAATDQPQVHAFADGAQFKRAMEEVMLETLALEPIPTSRKTGDKTSAYNDGWASYTGAFLTDSQSDAIIGQSIGTDLTQRLLQVFVGLPWARTLFQSRARKRVIEAEIQQRKRKLGGHSLDDLEAELQSIKRQIEDEALRSEAAARLLLSQQGYDNAARDVRGALIAWQSSRQEAEVARLGRLNADKLVREMEEERAAAAFFGRLSPKSCPRCSAKISKDRVEREISDHSCSVCFEAVEVPKEEIIQAEIALAKRRLVDAKAIEADANIFVLSREQQHKAARTLLNEAGELLNRLASSGTAGDLQALERRRERLEGMLEVANGVVNADTSDHDDLAVLQASEEEALARIQDTAKQVFGRVSDEVKRIVERLGMRDVETIELKRNANVTITKGGSVSSFGGLAAGEQLRLRIATVIALVRIARDHGVGRHPGLLLIDSPGNEELANSVLIEMLAELKDVVADTPGVQMFVAMRGDPNLFSELPRHRLKIAGAGEYLW